jgi:hypothetical protein
MVVENYAVKAFLRLGGRVAWRPSVDPLIPFIVTVTFDGGSERRDFSERFETLREASSYAEIARAMEGVRVVSIDFRLSERVSDAPIPIVN